MNKHTQDNISIFSGELQSMFFDIESIVLKDTSYSVSEKLWAKMPSYYNGQKVVRIIPFKDHINIAAAAILDHIDQLQGYKITPKGMLQIYLGQEIPFDVLEVIFKESLMG